MFAVCGQLGDLSLDKLLGELLGKLLGELLGDILARRILVPVGLSPVPCQLS